ncbi:MAG TPA: serine/threonine-protein kinase [Pyrinomonadaceae bacterium]|nr:serine/threonine-protein kinase [Pyrinomonadaceae bacterium]
MKWLSDQKLDHLRKVVSEPDFSGTKYSIIKELGSGGMGAVYLAHDRELDREVAIKVLHETDLSDDTKRRILREAQIIAQLEHPGIVPVHDVGSTEDGRVYYAMKFVRGNRLDEYAATVRTPGDRLRKFKSVCETVAFAHAHGVVHRDLKPQNIMIGSFGEVLVLDWGIAKVLSPTSLPDSEADTLKLRSTNTTFSPTPSHVTADGTIIGTRHYMSPEQARGEQIDSRTDVYSLGAVMYFLLTNTAPATRSDHSSAALPRAVEPSISKAAEAVCLKAMALERRDRYVSADELSTDVGHLLDAEPVSAYRENILEKTGRWLGKNRFFVLLVLAYLIMRIFFIFTARD